MDLAEDNRRITPRDYLELALRPMQGGGKGMAAKNEVLFLFACTCIYCGMIGDIHNKNRLCISILHITSVVP